MVGYNTHHCHVGVDRLDFIVGVDIEPCNIGCIYEAHTQKTK